MRKTFFALVVTMIAGAAAHAQSSTVGYDEYKKQQSLRYEKGEISFQEFQDNVNNYNVKLAKPVEAAKEVSVQPQPEVKAANNEGASRVQTAARPQATANEILINGKPYSDLKRELYARFEKGELSKEQLSDEARKLGDEYARLLRERNAAK